MDGTLVDSTAGVEGAWAVFKMSYPDIDVHDILSCKSPGKLRHRSRWPSLSSGPWRPHGRKSAHPLRHHRRRGARGRRAPVPVGVLILIFFSVREKPSGSKRPSSHPLLRTGDRASFSFPASKLPWTRHVVYSPQLVSDPKNLTSAKFAACPGAHVPHAVMGNLHLRDALLRVRRP